jgi:hypothetical protein
MANSANRAGHIVTGRDSPQDCLRWSLGRYLFFHYPCLFGPRSTNRITVRVQSVDKEKISKWFYCYNGGTRRQRKYRLRGWKLRRGMGANRWRKYIRNNLSKEYLFYSSTVSNSQKDSEFFRTWTKRRRYIDFDSQRSNLDGQTTE